jgi:hypothetical protein
MLNFDLIALSFEIPIRIVLFANSQLMAAQIGGHVDLSVKRMADLDSPWGSQLSLIVSASRGIRAHAAFTIARDWGYP